jgi:hypothetical protein
MPKENGIIATFNTGENNREITMTLYIFISIKFRPYGKTVLKVQS